MGTRPQRPPPLGLAGFSLSPPHGRRHSLSTTGSRPRAGQRVRHRIDLAAAIVRSGPVRTRPGGFTGRRTARPGPARSQSRRRHVARRASTAAVAAWRSGSAPTTRMTHPPEPAVPSVPSPRWRAPCEPARRHRTQSRRGGGLGRPGSLAGGPCRHSSSRYASGSGGTHGAAPQRLSAYSFRDCATLRRPHRPPPGGPRPWDLHRHRRPRGLRGLRRRACCWQLTVAARTRKIGRRGGSVGSEPVEVCA